MKTMTATLFRIAAATLPSLLLLAGCATDRHPPFPVQRYVPVSRAMLPLGELHLSNTEMSLAALEGAMQLQYVGLLPETAGNDLVGASVYRVKNSGKYFKQNTGKDAYCAETPRWVVVNSKTGAPAWSKEIWVGLLTLEDWSKVTPDAHYCAAGGYVRSAD